MCQVTTTKVTAHHCLLLAVFVSILSSGPERVKQSVTFCVAAMMITILLPPELWVHTHTISSMSPLLRQRFSLTCILKHLSLPAPVNHTCSTKEQKSLKRPHQITVRPPPDVTTVTKFSIPPSNEFHPASLHSNRA